ncbi:MAG: Amidohydrolase [Planctomycetes bacterium ADurb.Bin126]|nr:MAG: Amidohydrolase [Planctomycetes bacterium ADurb.Bin126]HOD83966.1 amidohydrolase family protein [Phycisphaerae bacterium]HQL72495.1 amidohydrolase family protein [Phycisphaerae bacterium]
MKTTRREFVTLAAGAIAAISARAGAADSPPAAGRYDGPIIDTHQHLWDLDKLRLPWVDGKLKRSFLPRDYDQAAAGLKIAKAVYMEVAVADEDKSKEARLILEQCRQRETVTVAAVVGGRLQDAGFREYLAPFQDDANLKGLRQIVPAPKGRPELYADKTFISHVRRLGELGLRFDLCPPPTGLGDALTLVEACGDTRFVLDHVGNAHPKAFAPGVAGTLTKPPHDADQWRRDVDRLAGKKNVVCKISGIVARCEEGKWQPGDIAPAINHCLDAFGPDRVMFAGDWPVCTRAATLRQWVEALKEIVACRPADQQRKLFHDNAAAFYGLAR